MLVLKKGGCCMNAGIIGMGRYVPEKIMKNIDLEKILDTTDEWIRSRTGIEERHLPQRMKTLQIWRFRRPKKQLKMRA